MWHGSLRCLAVVAGIACGAVVACDDPASGDPPDATDTVTTTTTVPVDCSPAPAWVVAVASAAAVQVLPTDDGDFFVLIQTTANQRPSGEVIRMDRDGRTVWRTSTPRLLQGLQDPDGDLLFVATPPDTFSRRGRLVTLDPNTGNIRRTIELLFKPSHIFAHADSFVIAGLSSGDFVTQTVDDEGRPETGGFTVSTPLAQVVDVALSGDHLVVATHREDPATETHNGQLLAFDAAGAVAWEAALGDGSCGVAVVGIEAHPAGGVVVLYVAPGGGGQAQERLAWVDGTGAVRWRTTQPDETRTVIDLNAFRVMRELILLGGVEKRGYFDEFRWVAAYDLDGNQHFSRTYTIRSGPPVSSLAVMPTGRLVLANAVSVLVTEPLPSCPDVLAPSDASGCGLL